MASELAAIRPVREDDYPAWRAMWDDYCAFYEATVPEETTDALWRRILGGNGDVRGLVAVDGGDTPLGFTHYVLHPHTWSTQTLCYLEDLFVKPEARGQSVGHALIQHLIDTGKAEGWRRVYWHTDAENARARRLYDRFTSVDPYVRYTVNL